MAWAQSIPTSLENTSGQQNKSLAVSITGPGVDFAPSTISNDPYEPGLEIRVYPNPANEYLMIQSEGRVTEIRVINLNGKVWNFELDKFRKKMRFPTSSIPSGQYFLEIHTPRGYLYRKIEIQH